MPTERITQSGKNLKVSLAGQLTTVVFNFLSRRIFLRMLGSEYMGFSGLCGHFLNFLSLLEPGFGAACAYALYRPLAFGDKKKVTQIMTYLRRIYGIIAAITLAVGVAVSPLLHIFTEKEMDSRFALTVFLLSLADTAVSYLFSHIQILPISDQKSYVVAAYEYVFFIISQFLRLFALARFKSYILYLLVGIFSGLAKEILLCRKIKKMYPYVYSPSPPLSKEEKNELVLRVKTLFCHKVGSVLCGSVDNMAVFAFLGLSGGAKYSNYTMLTGTCLAFVSVAVGALQASVGNLCVTSNGKRMQKVYSSAFLAEFMLGGFFAVSLFFVCPQIIELWVGAEMKLGTAETALFCTNMFISALRKTTGVFLDSFGLFEKEKYKAIAEAVLTFAATLAFAPKYGIFGVLLGQIAGASAFSLWYEPYILFKHGFKSGFCEFATDILKYVCALCLSFAASAALCFSVCGDSDSEWGIVLRISICAFSVVSVFSIMFFDSEKLSELVRYGKKMIRF